jgi:tight adherence protein C
MVFLISLACFLIATALTASAVYALTAESPVERRVRELTPKAEGARRREREPRAGLLNRFLASVGEFVFGAGSGRLSQTMSAAGLRRKNAVAYFLGLRTLISFGPGLVVLMWATSAGRPAMQTAFLSFLAWGVGHTLANFMLRRRAARRVQKLTESLPDALDLMVVCLESGLGLNATIARVGEERAAMHDPLGDEFAQVAAELRSGRSRAEAMRGLGDRNGTDDLKSLAGLIIQSDKLGASMTKTLRAHADLLRTRRRQRAEEAARKLPIKVLFPLATMLLPALFIMVAGPAFIQFSGLVEFLAKR